MYTLRMLGGIGLLTTDGREVDALLRQPKSMALLAYLAMPQPGTWHRRDTLLAAFWPEFDQARARTSLRNALYTLRRNLGDGAIRSRGDDEVSIDPELLATDVAAMVDDLAAGRYAEALSRYGGDLLPALYVAEAGGFEEWLEQERSRLKGLARKAAALLADARERDGDLAGAAEAARRGAELDPDDETAARRLIALFDLAGDRAQALAVYERFRKQVEEEFGVEPSAETLALVEAVRARQFAHMVTAERPQLGDGVVPPLPDAGLPVAPLAANPFARGTDPRANLAVGGASGRARGGSRDACRRTRRSGRQCRASGPESGRATHGQRDGRLDVRLHRVGIGRGRGPAPGGNRRAHHSLGGAVGMAGSYAP